MDSACIRCELRRSEGALAKGPAVVAGGPSHGLESVCAVPTAAVLAARSKRHAGHLHEHRHAHPGRKTVAVYYAEVPWSDSGRLDDAETRAIRWFDEQGYSLTNVAKTGRPHGEGTIEVTFSGEFGVELPWSRDERPRMLGVEPRSKEGCDSGARKRQFERLEGFGKFGRLIRCLARYVDETVPAPDATAGSGWYASARPRGRKLHKGTSTLCCVTVGSLEVLTAFESHGWLSGFLNFKAPEGGRTPWRNRPVPARRFCRNGHNAVRDSWTVDFLDFDELEALLECDAIPDACYRLNVELLRSGDSKNAYHSNAFLVREILNAVRKAGSGDVSRPLDLYVRALCHSRCAGLDLSRICQRCRCIHQQACRGMYVFS